MKKHWLILTVLNCAGIALSGCGTAALDSRYTLHLPDLPPAWQHLLGEPHWRIEWLNQDGKKQTITVRGNEKPEISLSPAWTSAVSIWPYWPQRGIGPGVFRPAGALFPFDAAGATLAASWRAGVDATLYWEMGRAAAGSGAAGNRLPLYFNWPRFRELFQDSSINAEIRADPWLADWHSIAEKTIQSGFDKRRLVPEARVALTLPVGSGPWAGASPFAPSLLFDTAPVFTVRKSVDTWVSSEGILRCNSKTWTLAAWE
ncbi:MAG: hypothetical protein LBD18_05095 [Treponema sp.]|jgi:hypothetical protein|nr:hypothetical protein [Treponema sp.]